MVHKGKNDADFYRSRNFLQETSALAYSLGMYCALRSLSKILSEWKESALCTEVCED